MRSDLRIVVDTNVIISGLFGIKNSPSYEIFEAIRSQKLILVLSPPIVEELEEVSGRERIVKRTKMSKEDRISFIEGVIEHSEVTRGVQMSKIIGRDVKDDMFLACAYEARANFIITGDRDLLELKKYGDTKIVTPREFVEYIKNKKI